MALLCLVLPYIVVFYAALLQLTAVTDCDVSRKLKTSYFSYNNMNLSKNACIAQLQLALKRSDTHMFKVQDYRVYREREREREREKDREKEIE